MYCDYEIAFISPRIIISVHLFESGLQAASTIFKVGECKVFSFIGKINVVCMCLLINVKYNEFVWYINCIC